MGEGTGQPDNAPRPDDATIIGGDATVVDGEIGMPAGPMPETIDSLKTAIGLFEALQIAEPDAGHDATAAEYQAQLDAITSGMEEPAAP